MFNEKIKLDFNINSGGYVVIFPLDRSSAEAATALKNAIDGAVGIINFSIGEEAYCGVLVDLESKGDEN